MAMANGQNQAKENIKLITLVEGVFTCLCRDFAKDGITVKIQIPENMVLWAEPVQIQQVFMNFILNARDAMLPHGGILTIKAKDDGNYTYIEFTDTGCGIEPSDLENIFDSFFSTKKNKNSPTECSGTGLGLAFCKQIIESHNGSISVESKLGQGSTFKIILPK